MANSKEAGPNAASLPLAGVKVLEIGQIIAGPFCTVMLAGLGAEVVKVEMPGHGDEMRSAGRYEGREAHEDYFNAHNYSKKSVVIDLKTPEGLELALRLAGKADVLVENFAPGTAERLGLGWSKVRERNPRIVYCSISGFGQSGPYRSWPAVDNIIQAISGVMSVTGQPELPPVQIGAPIADVTASMCAATSILGALYGVQRDGIGRYVDISMQAAFVYALSPRMGGVLHGVPPPKRLGNENPMRVPSDVYVTRDGVNLFINIVNDRGWPPFCRALKQPEWASDARFSANRARNSNRDIVNQLVREAMASWNSPELIERLIAERVPFAKVNDYAEAVADQQLLARGVVQEVEHITSGKVKVIGPPWTINEERPQMGAPPALGQHTDSVLREWLGPQK
jgi:formyl-CoA transferase